MTTVVSDTSPINYLCLIEAIEVLPRLFNGILIPPAVLAELRHPGAPSAVSSWLSRMPSWVTIQAPLALQTGLGLDPGETEAISLAMELKLPAIIIDEKDGRMVAERQGITPLGTLNVLYSADAHGFLDFLQSIERLRRTNFHVDNTLVETLITMVRVKRGG